MKSDLSPLAYAVTQNDATEPPHSSEFNDEHREGVYHCVVCDVPLFKSDAKFDAGCGWPSFFEPQGESMTYKSDFKLGYERKETRCANCDAHLGHVFPDGPPPTGKRYCINGVALTFVPAS